MLRLVILLLASGCVTLCNRDYYLVNEAMNWEEAQSYCRRNYTDLATIGSHDDMKRLVDMTAASGETREIWIGLKETGLTSSWLWSVGETWTSHGVAEYTNWASSPDSSHHCGGMRSDGKWLSALCETTLPFVCQEEEGSSAVHVVLENKSWRKAQEHCRLNDTDLASVMSLAENQALQQIVKEHELSLVWIGLFRDEWKWSDQSDSSFRYWEGSQPNNDGVCTLYRPSSKAWFDRGCTFQHPSYCYNDPLNTKEFKSVGQNETSITLRWKKVDGIPNYILLFSGGNITVTASEGQEQVNQTISGLTSGTKHDFTLFTLFGNVRSSGVKLTALTAPRNAKQFKSVGQNVTSITLQWKKLVKFLKYTLWFNGKEINVTASKGEKQVNHTISGLTNGTTYNFTLFTLFENVRSSGVQLTAATECVTLCHREYYLINEAKNWEEAQSYCRRYYTDLATITRHDDMKRLVDMTAASGETREIWIGLKKTGLTSPWLWSVGETWTSHGVAEYTNWTSSPDSSHHCGGMRSDGKWLSALCETTLPFVCQEDERSGGAHVVLENKSWRKAQEHCRLNNTDLASVMSLAENQALQQIVKEHELSLVWIGLFRDEWKWSDRSDSSFRYWEGAQPNNDGVCTLYRPSSKSWFDRGCTSHHPSYCYNERLSAKEFQSLGQNETSITLQWKKVVDILIYTLWFNGKEVNVTASEGQEQVNHTISELTSGTTYDFTLFTLFGNVKSSGVQLTTVTAPRNAEEFKSVGQSETSITLQWKKVDSIYDYILLFNGGSITMTASEGEELVKQIILGLTSATKYDFTLFSLFENVRSSGVKLAALTAPRNTKEFKAVGQTETSITLQWKKLVKFLKYTLWFTGKEVNVTASEGEKQVNHTISGLTSGTKYNFTLFTLFENVRSSRVKLTALTVPRNTKEFKAVGQTETSITLQWKKVVNILKYTLWFTGKEINVTASKEQKQMELTISGLTSGTKYDFTLFALFGNVRSSGVQLTAATKNKVVRKIVRVEIKSKSSCNFKDSEVSENILNQLQEKYPGVKLQWKVQPDGKIFHKKQQKNN